MKCYLQFQATVLLQFLGMAEGEAPAVVLLLKVLPVTWVQSQLYRFLAPVDLTPSHRRFGSTGLERQPLNLFWLGNFEVPQHSLAKHSLPHVPAARPQHH